jgi:hypothetical protein
LSSEIPNQAYSFHTQACFTRCNRISMHNSTEQEVEGKLRTLGWEARSPTFFKCCFPDNERLSNCIAATQKAVKLAWMWLVRNSEPPQRSRTNAKCMTLGWLMVCKSTMHPQWSWVMNRCRDWHAAKMRGLHNNVNLKSFKTLMQLMD